MGIFKNDNVNLRASGANLLAYRSGVGEK